MLQLLRYFQGHEDKFPRDFFISLICRFVKPGFEKKNARQARIFNCVKGERRDAAPIGNTLSNVSPIGAARDFCPFHYDFGFPLKIRQAR